MDVDGTLTDGRLYIGSEGEFFKAFNVKDGYGIHNIMIPKGIEPIIITGRQSKIVENRCRELGITQIYQGVQDKIAKLRELIKDEELESTGYFGDDINDLDCMRSVQAAGGITGCPADAVDEVKNVADFISSQKGGNGAIREFVEWLIYDKTVQNDEEDVLQNTRNILADRLFSITINEYFKEWERANTLNAKSGVFITVIIAILAIYISKVPFNKMGVLTGEKWKLIISGACTGFLMVSFIFIIFAFVEFWAVFKLRDYEKPNIDKSKNEIGNAMEKNMMEEVMTEYYRNLISHNAEINDNKVKKISAGIRSSIVGISIMIIATIVLMLI